MRTKMEERCLDLGVGVVMYLQKTNGHGLTKRNREQLASSATSIGANVAEARSAQSRPDFISKMEIALKEARESDYWLAILRRVSPSSDDELERLTQECDEITAMLVSTVKTSKANLGWLVQKGRAEIRS